MTVDLRTLSEQVYHTLRSDILASRLAPGEELAEVGLAERLGTSRGPVREAMRRLAAEGLVVVRPRRGAVVSALSRTEFLEAYQVRGALEVLAVTSGTPLCTPEHLARLEASIDTMEELAISGDEEGFFNVNRQLHRELCALPGNQTLLEIYEQLMDRMERYSHRSAMLRGDLMSSVLEHRRIVGAIKDGDARAAGALTEDHIGIPLERVRALTDEAWEELD